MSERERDDASEQEPRPAGDETDTDTAGRDEVDEASEEAFPASDPPSF